MKGNLTYSAAIGLGITKQIGAYFETYGEVIEFSEWISNFDSGITYMLKDNMQFDSSFGLGLNQKINFFSIGYSMNISQKPQYK